MVIHKDSIDESLLNQLKSYFQTVIYSVGKTSLLSSPQICLKYVIEIESKNLKSSKMTSHTETKHNEHSTSAMRNAPQFSTGHNSPAETSQ